MATMNRYRITWSGYIGGPGYSTFYGLDTATAQDFANACAAFMRDATKIATNGDTLPAGLKLTGDSFVSVLQVESGFQQGDVPVTLPSTITGTSETPGPGASGACVTWVTGSFVNGRRVRGRTYLVPLGGTAYQTDGTLSTAYLTALRNAANAFVASTGKPAVWHRPTDPLPSGGQIFPVIAANVVDKAAVLTSRRD